MDLAQHRYLVNWTDGMKINKDHFVMSENYYHQQIKDIRYHYKRNNEFGILPSLDGDKSLQMYLTDDELLVNKCIAVTGDGSYINVNEDHPLRLNSENINSMINALNDKNASVYIIVRVNNFERIPTGQPDPEELPLRMPFASVSYTLDLMSESQLNKDMLSTSNIIAIGKLIQEGTAIRIDEEFIAPCPHIMNNEILSHYYDKWILALERTNKNAIKVVHNVNENPKRKILATGFRHLSQNIMVHISSRIDYFKLCKRSVSPIELLAFGLGYARVLRNSIESTFHNEQLIKYICLYTPSIDDDPSLFKQFIEQNVLGMSYDALNLQRYFRRMNRLIDAIDQIYNVLPTLSLENDQKDGGLFVNVDESIM